VDKAQQIGIDWWKSDPALSSEARRQQLEDRLELLEARSRGARDEREHLPERDQKKADRNR
jgi:hypothetical protein